MYGLNGLHPSVSVKLWNTYIVPRLTYGLESIPLTPNNIENLEMFQRLTLRYIQHLPPGTANAAVLLLTGTLPIEAIIDRKVLTAYVSMCRLENSKERDIIQRQIAMKSGDSNSHIARVKELITKYSLPSAYQLYEDPPSKLKWKKQVKEAINIYWTNHLRHEASHKTTLMYLSIAACTMGKVHPVWRSTLYSRVDLIRANVKVKIITQQYQVQCKQAKYRGGSDLCRLCSKAPEDLKHFLIKCCATKTERSKGMRELGHVLVPAIGHERWYSLMNSDTSLMHLVVDCRHSTLGLPDDEYLLNKVEHITRLMCYSMHCARAAK